METQTTNQMNDNQEGKGDSRGSFTSFSFLASMDHYLLIMKETDSFPYKYIL
jgi:hypothetical protein